MEAYSHSPGRTTATTNGTVSAGGATARGPASTFGTTAPITQRSICTPHHSAFTFGRFSNFTLPALKTLTTQITYPACITVISRGQVILPSGRAYNIRTIYSPKSPCSILPASSRKDYQDCAYLRSTERKQANKEGSLHNHIAMEYVHRVSSQSLPSAVRLETVLYHNRHPAAPRTTTATSSHQ